MNSLDQLEGLPVFALSWVTGMSADHVPCRSSGWITPVRLSARSNARRAIRAENTTPPPALSATRRLRQPLCVSPTRVRAPEFQAAGFLLDLERGSSAP